MMGFPEPVILAEVINLLAYSVTRNVFIKLRRVTEIIMLEIWIILSILWRS